MVVKMSDLKELALKKLAKTLPKTKTALEAFIHGEPSPAPKTKKELPAEVKVAKEHLKKVDCPVVHHSEMDDKKSHKEVVKHLESKDCPEVPAIKKKVREQKKVEKSVEKSDEPKAPKVKKPRKVKVQEQPEIIY